MQNLKVVIALSLSLSLGMAAFSQTQESGEEMVTEEQLRMAIEIRGGAIPEIKKKDALIDSLRLQVSDLSTLVELLDEQVDSLAAPSDLDLTIWPLPLLKEDETVFKLENLSGMAVPAALRGHYELVCAVSEIERLLDETYRKVSEVTAFCNQNNLDVAGLIQPAIQENVNSMFGLFTKLQSMNQSSLSRQQLDYIDKLTKRYNDLSQYYE